MKAAPQGLPLSLVGERRFLSLILIERLSVHPFRIFFADLSSRIPAGEIEMRWRFRSIHPLPHRHSPPAKSWAIMQVELTIHDHSGNPTIHRHSHPLKV